MSELDLISQALDALPAGKRIALLMRHSVRYEIKTDAEVFTAGLTPEGVALAEQLGVLLAGRRKIERIFSSPVGRCVDTALAIARSAGWEHKVRIENRLSHPFIAPIWDRLPLCYPRDPVPEPLNGLASLLFDRPDLPNSLDLFVTHDTVVGSLAAYLYCENYRLGNWPNYLEGAFLWEEDDRIQVLWRGQQRSLPRADATGRTAYQYYLGL